jgi:hypothetical protein
LISLELHYTDDLFYCLAGVKQRQIYLKFVILNAAHVKSVLNDILKVHCRTGDDRQEFVSDQVLFGDLSCENFYHRYYRVERRAEFVSD